MNTAVKGSATVQTVAIKVNCGACLSPQCSGLAAKTNQLIEMFNDTQFNPLVNNAMWEVVGVCFFQPLLNELLARVFKSYVNVSFDFFSCVFYRDRYVIYRESHNYPMQLITACIFTDIKYIYLRWTSACEPRWKLQSVPILPHRLHCASLPR